MNYYIKAYALLIKRIVLKMEMPFHSKEMNLQERMKPENKKYLRNGIWKTAKMIAKSEGRLHWLR